MTTAGDILVLATVSVFAQGTMRDTADRNKKDAFLTLRCIMFVSDTLEEVFKK